MRKGSGSMITHEGRTQSVAQWALELGIPAGTIYSRVKAGHAALSAESLKMTYAQPMVKLSVKLAKDEAEMAHSVADSCGMSFSRWARDLILKALER
ncbi:MAG TPA: hypothetical protein VE176_01640 [Candidatus Limnocylindrales bacterium]|nr:hypothetical protein [Candidatus Limnocylindrales bacterium]